MIRALFLAAVLLRCPGDGGAANPARLYELDSAERIPVERQPAPHGPQVDTGDLSGDPYSAYPGLGFGPMGPVARSALPNDATLRSLSSSSSNDDGDDGGSGEQQLDSDSQQIAAHSADAELSPKPEYHIISVEFPRVETPFVIGIWIFFASIAKIGESVSSRLFARRLRLFLSPCGAFGFVSEDKGDGCIPRSRIETREQREAGLFAARLTSSAEFSVAKAAGDKTDTAPATNICNSLN